MDAGLSSPTRPFIDLEGRNAVVTGGSRGVGRATALMLARAGANVGIGYRSREPEAAAVVEELRQLGVQAWAEGGDLAEPEEAEQLLLRADEEFDGLDIFVANHGVWPPEDVPITTMTDAQWHRTVAVNLDAVFYTCRAACARIRDGGRLVLVSSTAGQRGEAYHADYAATKGALISMVKGLCIELADRDVTVNCVAPGWIEGEMAEPAYRELGMEMVTRGIPLGRVASYDDVAGPILFLCSKLARHVTGEVLNVNGGAVLVG